MFQKKTPAMKMSFGGIMMALSWVTVFIASFIPGLELSFFSLSTLFVVIVVAELSAFNGWIFYAANAILALVMLPNKVAVLPYIFFFGLYGLVKFYIETIGKRPLEYLLKLLFFNGAWALILLVFQSAFLTETGLGDKPLPVLLIGAQVMFLLYDEILTRLYTYYHRRFHKRMGGRMM